MNNMRTQTPKRARIVLIGLLVLTGLGVAGFFVWGSIKKAVVRRSIVRAVREKSGGLYSLWYKNLDINERRGSLHVRKLTITPNMAVFRELEGDKKHPPVLVSVQVPDIRVSGIRTRKTMLNREIVGGKIVIDHPVIDIILTRGAVRDTTVIYDSAFYRQLLGNLELIRMDTISIVDALVRVRDLGNRENRLLASNVSLQLHDLLIDSVSGRDRNRLLFSKDIALRCDTLRLNPGTDKYNNTILHFQFSQRDRAFSIDRMTVTPLLGEPEFAGSFSTQKDRFDVGMQKIRLAGVDINALEKGELRADSFIIGRSNYKIYRDLSYPRADQNRVGRYPHQLLMRIPFPLLVRHVLCPAAYVEYKERNPRSEKSGAVQFYEVTASMQHVTNIVEEADSNNISTLNLSARLLNKAPLKAVFSFYLNDKEGRFTLKGSLGGMQATDLNPLLEPIALVKIETGAIDHMNFTVYGNDYGANASVVILYNNLRISLLKKEKETKVIEKRPLASFAANLLVQNDNPGRNGKLRVGTVQYKRDTTRSFFNLVWKSIFAGVKQATGLKGASSQ